MNLVKVAVPVPLRQQFDYLLPEKKYIAPGVRVKVPLGRRQTIGIVMGQCEKTTIASSRLKEIVAVCDSEPLLPACLCDFFEKVADYYHHPIGEVVLTSLPRALRQAKPLPPVSCLWANRQNNPALVLNTKQQDALKAILACLDQFYCFLLQGVTGSGKTEVYLQAVAKVLDQGKAVLVLVPEISLTPQTKERFVSRFGDVVVCYHSQMTPKKRLEAWTRVRQQKAPIVIGTRSAVFMPFSQLGLIVIDEEHDPSFKQQEGFRYSARDVAVWRAKLLGCPVILGSATPAFESLANAKAGKYQLLVLPERATQVKPPEVTLLDVGQQKLKAGLSPLLLAQIALRLEKKEQVLLFINRRGYAPTYMCLNCHWLATCPRCDARLTLYSEQSTLVCHYCLFRCSCPPRCPTCQSTALQPVGYGTQRLEESLKAHFPQATLARIDSDATRKKGYLEEILTKTKDNEIQLLIGTQILAKGHHFPHLRLVAILDADGGLFSADFRAVEKMAQLIIQVAGRAGRVHQAGEVFIQTSHPAHPFLRALFKQDYAKLTETLLDERARCHLPPFSHLALIRAYAKTADLPQKLLLHVQKGLAPYLHEAVKILGPVPAPMLKRQGYYHFQLLLQSSSRRALHQMLGYCTPLLEKSTLARRTRWSLDIDPQEMF